MRIGLCDAAEQARCREEIDDDDNLEWACKQCEKKKLADLHDYTIKLIGLHNLQTAGYPLSAGDLTLEEWQDLGRLKLCLQQIPPRSKSVSRSTAREA